jgi:cell division protein FtsQ
MAKKRKISIRKIIQLVLTVVVTSCCITAMISASKIEDKKTLKDVAIHFKNDKKYHFIEEKEILDLAINQTNTDIQHTPLARLDVHAMEKLIRADPWVANAQVFVDNDRVLHMYVTQRIPVVRVFQRDSKSFYLDTTMSIMPLSANYIYYTTVVTNVPEFKNDSGSWALRKDIVSLVRTIQADSFWNAQISQIIVDSAGMYELVPIIGDHRILLGDATRTREKLNNLFAFYKNVLNRIGWDKYQVLDIRFGGQVVASPSLPYSGPVDKVVTNMNWISSIVETEARNDSKDSVNVTDVKGAEKTKPVAKQTKPGVKTATTTKHIAKAAAKKPTKILSNKLRKQNALAKNKKNNKKQTKQKYVYPNKKSNKQ